MIKNDKQYAIAKSHVEKLRELFDLVSQDVSRSLSPIGGLELKSVSGEITQLSAELAEYDELKSGKSIVSKITAIDQLPRLLIRARIAAGLSQKELAEALNLKEQQIQRYEANEYAGASIGRLADIASKLGIKLNTEIEITERAQADQMIRRLVSAGIHPEIINTRLTASAEQMPPDLLSLVANVSRIYGWTADALRGAGELIPRGPAMATAHFKTAHAVDAKKFAAYTVYAYFLAGLSIQATPQLAAPHIPRSAIDFRNLVLSFGELTFENLVKCIWNCGVVILPLDDPGAFHAAMWKFAGRPAIVLKQRNRSSGRWLFDLLHEVWHVIENADVRDAQVIDVQYVLREQATSSSEKRANIFAADVLLDSRADELAEAAVQSASGNIEWLARSTTTIAMKAGVSVSALALHLAHLIDEDYKGKLNWWASAEKLSKTTENHWMIARDMFLGHADFSVLTAVDRELLVAALKESST